MLMNLLIYIYLHFVLRIRTLILTGMAKFANHAKFHKFGITPDAVVFILTSPVISGVPQIYYIDIQDTRAYLFQGSLEKKGSNQGNNTSLHCPVFCEWWSFVARLKFLVTIYD